MRKISYGIAPFLEAAALTLIVLFSKGDLVVIGSAIIFGLSAFIQGMRTEEKS